MHGIYETISAMVVYQIGLIFMVKWDSEIAPHLGLSLHLIVTSLLNVKEFSVLGEFGHCSFVRGRLFPTKRTRAHVLPICKSWQENYVALFVS